MMIDLTSDEADGPAKVGVSIERNLMSPTGSSRAESMAHSVTPRKKGPRLKRTRVATRGTTQDIGRVAQGWYEEGDRDREEEDSLGVEEPSVKRGPGRPITTGEYSGRAAAKKALNDEREREINLELQARTQSMEDTRTILRRSKLYPEESAEKGKMVPTADLASQIREAQAEVVRVSKISSNLQGPLQRSLRVATSLTMGLTDVLRTRADGLGVEVEILQLRELVADLKKDQEKTNLEITQMRDAMVKAKAETEAANQKSRMVKQSLKESIRKNDERC